MYLLKTHSDFSLLNSLPQVENIVSYCKELGYDGVALTDYNNVNGVIQFSKAAKKAEVKSINGLQITLPEGDLTVLAKDRPTFEDLIRCSSRQHLNNFSLNEVPSSLIGYSGYLGSSLFNCIFTDWKSAIQETSYEGAKGLVSPDWEKNVTKLALLYKEYFGQFYIAIQRNNVAELPATDISSKILRHISKKLKLPKVFVHDSHYLKREDAFDHRVLLCVGVNGAILRTVEDKIRRSGREEKLRFFRSNNHQIPTKEEVAALYEEDEIKNSDEIGASCSLYDTSNPPRLPDIKNAEEKLKELCRKGWLTKVKGKPNESVYEDRIKRELKVIEETGVLAKYLVMVHDVCHWFRSHDGWIMGRARGSAGGCLTSYLCGITEIDPIEFDLSFERFYNAGRNTKDRVKMPDIDLDFPRGKRDLVIQYLRDKWGKGNVCHMVVYSRMQGRSVIKDVLRVHNKLSNQEVNRITDFIPDESKISDKLQEMEEKEGSSSIIRWALRNNTKDLGEWATLNENGRCEGEFGFYFEQAMRLEGIKRNQGQHASGILVTPVPLVECCPMAPNNHGELIASWEMEDLEYAGFLKLDILGVKTFDIIMGVQNYVRTGKIEW